MYVLPMKHIETKLRGGKDFDINYPDFLITHLESIQSGGMKIGDIKLTLLILKKLDNVKENDYDSLELTDDEYNIVKGKVENITWLVASEAIVEFYEDIVEASPVPQIEESET